jgi:hypothetical protein
MKLHLHARVSSDSPDTIGRFLRDKFGAASISRDGDDWTVHAVIDGKSAREANRRLLAELRRFERKAHLRAEWTHAGLTERFFDYVPMGSGPAVA